MLVEKLARYQAAKMPEKQSDWLASIGNLWRSAAVAIRSAGDIIGHTSEVLGHKLLTLDPRSRVVRIRFPGGVGASKFAPTQAVDSQFPETP